MPNLTAKAAAELLALPAYEQLRIITEQKYPHRKPNSFRTSFYSPALRAITRFYREGNNPRVIQLAHERLDTLRPDSRRINNRRVLESFAASPQFARQLDIRPSGQYQAAIGDVVIRLAPDILAHDNGSPKVIYYNLRSAAIPPEIARCTIEIAHWIFEANGIRLPITAIEYVDLVENSVHTTARRRKRTIDRLRANAHVISALWDSV